MVGDALTPSVYDVHIKIRGAPVLVRRLHAAGLVQMIGMAVDQSLDWEEPSWQTAVLHAGVQGYLQTPHLKQPCMPDICCRTAHCTRTQMEAGQEAHQRMVNDKLTVAELAATALVALPPLVPLRELADTLRACRHQAFPVTSDVKAAYQSGMC